MRSRTLALAVAAAGLALTACTGTPAPSPSASTASTAAVDPGRVSPSLKPLPTVSTVGGAIKDLTLADCKTDAGDQSVEGTLKSSQKETQDFLVTVSWTTAQGDVMGRGYQVVKSLAPGDSKKISITAKVAQGAVRCVPGVTYGAIKG